MIIWLTSYPKSGNTWDRSFLSSLIYTEDGNANFDSIKKISQYPLRSHFKGISSNIDDIYSIAENWINSQDLLNLDNFDSLFSLQLRNKQDSLNQINPCKHQNLFVYILVTSAPWKFLWIEARSCY